MGDTKTCSLVGWAVYVHFQRHSLGGSTLVYSLLLLLLLLLLIIIIIIIIIIIVNSLNHAHSNFHHVCLYVIKEAR